MSTTLYVKLVFDNTTTPEDISKIQDIFEQLKVGTDQIESVTSTTSAEDFKFVAMGYSQVVKDFNSWRHIAGTSYSIPCDEPLESEYESYLQQ